MSCFFVNRDAFDLSFTLTDTVFAQIKNFLKIRIEDIYFLSNIVEFVGVAFSIIRHILPSTISHEIKHWNLPINLLDLLILLIGYLV